MVESQEHEREREENVKRLTLDPLLFLLAAAAGASAAILTTVVERRGGKKRGGERDEHGKARCDDDDRITVDPLQPRYLLCKAPGGGARCEEES